MGRDFSLAGLLRLRHIQEEQAASDLAAANARLRENFNRRTRTREALGDSNTSVTNTAALLAVAAARSSTRSMLAELEAAGQERAGEVAEAQDAFQSARAQSIGLEKLEGKHREAVAAEDLRLEQGVLDEIASTSWHRDQAGDTDHRGNHNEGGDA